ELLTFDRFIPGAPLGAVERTASAALCAQWAALYPWDAPGDDGLAPIGLMSVLMMNAYMEVIAPRPPGNIHGSQRFQVHEAPRIGETLRCAFTCSNKTLRGERRLVDLEMTATGAGGRPL